MTPQLPRIVITIGSSHIRRIDLASPRRVRKMSSTAVYKACAKMKKQGVKPLCAVDDLSMHAVGPWIGNFAHGLTGAAKREGISIVGGEMAQMPDTYKRGYVGIIVYVTGIEV